MKAPCGKDECFASVDKEGNNTYGTGELKDGLWEHPCELCEIYYERRYYVVEETGHPDLKWEVVRHPENESIAMCFEERWSHKLRSLLMAEKNSDLCTHDSEIVEFLFENYDVTLPDAKAVVEKHQETVNECIRGGFTVERSGTAVADKAGLKRTSMANPAEGSGVSVR